MVLLVVFFYIALEAPSSSEQTAAGERAPCDRSNKCATAAGPGTINGRQDPEGRNIRL